MLLAPTASTLETALKYMVKAGTHPAGPHGGSERPFLAEYRKLGYVPIDKIDTAASVTLEYANADFAVAQFAKNLGDDADYQLFLKQSKNWTSLFDPSTGWIRPRQSDGTWLPGFDADRSLPKTKVSWDKADQEGFEEGNTYQYTFMIPFDYPTLFAAIGGDEQGRSRASTYFLLKAPLLGRALLQHGERARLRHSLRVCLRRRAVDDPKRSHAHRQ